MVNEWIRTHIIAICRILLIGNVVGINKETYKPEQKGYSYCKSLGETELADIKP